MLPSGELAEVASSFGGGFVIELENNLSGVLAVDLEVHLRQETQNNCLESPSACL